MSPLRKRTREQARHERAVVLQHLGTPTAAAIRADLAANRARAARLRTKASSTGVNTGPPSNDKSPVKDAQQNRPTYGGNLTPAGVPAPVEPPTCTYCNDWGCYRCGR